jgi:hypothetical protein
MGLKDLQAKYKMSVRILMDPIEINTSFGYITWAYIYFFYQHNDMFIYITGPSNIQRDH